MNFLVRRNKVVVAKVDSAYMRAQCIRIKN